MRQFFRPSSCTIRVSIVIVSVESMRVRNSARCISGLDQRLLLPQVSEKLLLTHGGNQSGKINFGLAHNRLTVVKLHANLST